MHAKGKPYDHRPVEKHVAKVPLFGATWGPNEYPLIVGSTLVGGKPIKEIILMRRFSEEPELEKKIRQDLQARGIKIHELPIDLSRELSDGDKRKLIQASEILNHNVERGIPTAVTCHLGLRQTEAVRLLGHLTRGATLNEALKLVDLHKEHVPEIKRLFEERHKYK